MRSVAGLIPRVGAPLPYAVSRPIELVEVELAPLDEGEVLVRIEADGICHSDLSVVNGTRKHPLPIVGGHESAGIDAEVGPPAFELLSISALSPTSDIKTTKGSYLGSSNLRKDISDFVEFWWAGKLPVEKLLTATRLMSEVNETMDALNGAQVIRQVILPH